MPSTEDMDWIVISLGRTPERLEAFSAVNAHLGLPFEVLAAVDGRELDEAELIRSGLIRPGLGWPVGSLGAAFSHRLCWLRAIESGRPLCIFEDDTILRHDFATSAMALMAELPHSWDIVHFGFNTDAVLDVEALAGLDAIGYFTLPYLEPHSLDRFAATGGRVQPVKLNNVFGTSSYAVSPAGAQKLLDGCFPLDTRYVPVRALEWMLVTKSNDGLMNSLYRHIGAYVCMPPIAMPINNKRTSTVNV